MKGAVFQGRAALLAVCAACVLGGCENAVPRTDYMPLRDGNRWEYRLLDRPLLQRLSQGQAVLTAPLESGPPAGETVEPKAEVLESLPGEKPPAPAAQPALARRVVLELRAPVDDLTYRAQYDTAEQVWSKRNAYISFQSTRGRSYLLILPPHTGYRWIVAGPGGQDLSFEIESAHAELGTPAGRFSACAVARQESRDRREVCRYWFAPDVGLVRRSRYFAGEEVFRQELVAYHVQPGTPAARRAEAQEVEQALSGRPHGSEFRRRVQDERAARWDASENADTSSEGQDAGRPR
jgi:hypothetical protein